MKTWEYKNFSTDPEELNKAGSEGWEIIGIDNGSTLAKRWNKEEDIKTEIARRTVGLPKGDVVTDQDIEEYNKKIKAKTEEELVKKTLGFVKLTDEEKAWHPVKMLWDNMTRKEQEAACKKHGVSWDFANNHVQDI